MTTETLTISGFLLARIAEDEAIAQASPTNTWRVGLVPPPGHWAAAQVRGGVWTEFRNGHATVVVEVPRGGGGRPGVEPHIARHDPARVLAECEAKKRIVVRFQQVQQFVWSQIPDVSATASAERGELEWVVRVLAQSYADHPDFRQEWAT